MSGFIGVVNLNGEAIDAALLHRLTAVLADRGPDGQKVWTSGPVGFGNARLCTTNDSEDRQQPISLDGKVWITADARIDGRGDLLAKLALHGITEPEKLDDAELILHAYQKWGEGCTEHLIGDFAFLIWDGPSGKLFCACDHFGVKPFYYAVTSNSLVLGNSLDCVRAHPSVSSELNEQAVADFLLFDFNHYTDITTFKDVRRLPPAHTLVWDRRGLKITRYWKMAVNGAVRYRRTRDYVERYMELLEQAVSDRVRADRVAIFMSGGLDSTSVAATAAGLKSLKGAENSLRAYTAVYDRLMPDRERHYSGLAARGLGIPIEYLALDDFRLYQDAYNPRAFRPEPLNEPLIAMIVEQMGQVSRHGRVLLTGYGGDAVFRMSRISILSRQFFRLVLRSPRYFASYGRVPKIGLRSGIKKLARKSEVKWVPDYPRWLNRDFEARLKLRERWDYIWGEPQRVHRVRPEAYQSLEHPLWRFIFENSDPGAVRFNVESRHPLFDIRLVNYLLALPNEIFFDKDLARIAMRHRLPKAVRSRPKTPLVDSPLRVVAGQFDALMRDFRPALRLSEYVDTDLIPRRVDESDDGNGLWVNLRPVSLDNWLKQPGV